MAQQTAADADRDTCRVLYEPQLVMRSSERLLNIRELVQGSALCLFEVFHTIIMAWYPPKTDPKNENNF